MDIKLIESLFPFDWMGWKIQRHAHQSPSYLTQAGVLRCCVLFMLFVYGLFNKAVTALIQSEAGMSSSYHAEVWKVLRTTG